MKQPIDHVIDQVVAEIRSRQDLLKQLQKFKSEQEMKRRASALPPGRAPKPGMTGD